MTVLKSTEPKNTYSGLKNLTNLLDQNFSTRYRILKSTQFTVKSVNAIGTISNNSILSFDFDEWLAKNSTSFTKKNINTISNGIKNS